MPVDRTPPSHVLFIPTYRCNLRCPYCLVFDPVRYWQYDPSIPLPPAVAERELTTDEILERVIPECERLGVKVFALTGGEVMLRKDIDRIIRRLGMSGMDWCIDSNLSRCTPELAHEVVAAGCDTVFVSIDGNEAVHNQMRASRFAFHQATRGLRNIAIARAEARTVRPRIVLNCVLQPGNETAPPDIVSLAEEHGADGTAFQLLSKLAYDAAPFDSGTAISALGSARRAADASGIEMSVFPLPRPTAEQLDQWFGVSPPSAGFFEVCTYVESSLRIDPAGNVIPCIENSVGNVLERDLGEIWSGPEYQLFRDHIHAAPIDACHRCCNMTA